MAQLFCIGKVDGPLDLPDPSPYDVVDYPPPFDSSDDEDEDRFFAGLTRRLTQSKSFAGVPSRRLAAASYPVNENHESTLTGTTKCFAPTGVSKFRVPPPADTERLDTAFSVGALEIDNLRMVPQEHRHFGTRCSGKQASPFGLHPEQDRLPWTQILTPDPFSLPQRRHAGEGEVVNQQRDVLLIALQRKRQQQQVQAQMRELGLGEVSRFGRTHSFPHPGWTSSKVGPYGNGSAASRGSAGTGVFLPRGYGEVAPELQSRRKSGGGSSPAVIVPAKVARALNLNVHHLQDHGGLLLARRNAVLMQEKGLSASGSLNHHHHHHGHHHPDPRVMVLPQEWSY